MSKTRASSTTHDSQVAIPLATITAARVTNLHDRMDSAHDAPEIWDKSRALGHAPIVDHKTRRGETAAIEAEARAKRFAGYQLAEDLRYRQRSSAERVNADLKDNCGGNHVRVRGAAKVFCHLMFGVLVVAVEQMMRLVTQPSADGIEGVNQGPRGSSCVQIAASSASNPDMHPQGDPPGRSGARQLSWSPQFCKRLRRVGLGGPLPSGYGRSCRRRALSARRPARGTRMMHDVPLAARDRPQTPTLGIGLDPYSAPLANLTKLGL